MLEGIVKTITSKNYGFIRVPNGNEYFFHKADFNGFWDDLVHDYERRDTSVKVRFEVVDSPKGPRAGNVTRMDFPN
jgi:cold shock CspA family protein